MKKIKLLSIVSFCILGWNVFGQVSGTVFRDFNANGTKDNSVTFNEDGVEGVTVKAYPISGSVQTTTTASNGSYSFTGLILPARIEFSGFQIGDFSGPVGLENSSSIQIYTSSTTSANFGLNYPSDFCQSNPKALTPVYFSGDPSQIPNLKAVVSYQYNAVSPDTYTIDAQQGEVGTIYGVAYNKVKKLAFLGSFIKRHTGLGNLGIGGLYKIDYSSGSGIASNFVDLEALGVDFGSIDDNITRGLTNNTTPSIDITAFGKSLKEGMGDIELSDDGNKLYVVNLFQRNITVVDLTSFNSSGNPITSTNISTIALPNLNCNNGVARPFGLKYYRGELYLSVTCTAENAGSTISDLDGYVYSYNGTIWTQKLNIPLDYKFYGSVNSTFGVEDPIVWTDIPSDVIDDSNPQEPTVYRVDKKQPMLADIEFDIDGSMIIGAIDRSAIQFGHFQFFPPGYGIDPNRMVLVFSNGDIYRAAKNGSTYLLENAGISGSISGCGAQNNNNYPYSGPGGGEFYCGDSWVGGHLERALGALALLPGTNEVITTAYDPIQTVNNGGVITMKNSDGSYVRGFILYDSNYPPPDPGSFSKGHGLGDIEILCNPAPIEIGNRVWMDTDNDGVQDPNEMGLDGITVKLYNGTNLIAVKTTSNGGQYYFSTADGVLPKTTYTIRIEAASIPSGKSVTLKDQLTGGIQDMGDNDASLISSNADITFTTGLVGENNHTLDFGFYTCQPDSIKICSTQSAELVAPDGYTNYVWYIINSPGDTMQVATGQTFTTSTVGNYIYKAIDGAGCPISLCCPTTVADSICLSCSSSLTATPGNCNPADNLYTLTGNIQITSAPTSGTLTIQIVGGGSQTFDLSTGIPTSYSIANQSSDGANHTVTLTISGVSCASSTTYNAPVNCLFTCPSPNCASLKTKYIIKN